MALTDALNQDLKSAMKAHDKVALNVIRAIKTALTNEKIDSGKDLTEDDERAVLATQLKQRKDSLEQFSAGGREDLAAETKAEITIVEKYLPAQLDEAAISKLVAESIKEVGATNPKQFGLVMKSLMPKVKGQADGAVVSRIVKDQLNA
ncbi:GatB/YqeY domain-containing protein [Lacticaseibacillus pabuli]|uniref:GatB/YqeY domain-containing protein n=1 Tax=Lacticaseibacillus pabuli TaxID=3025672 RepID=A0ABY7WXI2_9LACO|nr:GatB/YqeY domain-containing protein [Lacticaseibacillus sp. KACC 23028]WDF83784.1 GatB/YqeY domain-containing protein [Lacticaseibacillus sp. KACC 23028]